MDLLKRPAVLALLLLVWLGVGACLSSERTVQSSRFSHRTHVEMAGLDCSMCHSAALTRNRSAYPGPQLCGPCHDRIDAAKPETERVAALFDQDGRFPASGVARLGDELIFDHGHHTATLGIDCSTCHGDIARSDGIPAPRIAKDDCMNCHADSGLENECSTCHSEVDGDWLPPSHLRSWDVRHGQVVRAGDEASVHRCDLCHSEETSCQACHQVQMPRNHTNFWRRRGHGVAVSMDRTSCMTCHRSDFCERCHLSTVPVSHTGSFGAPQNRHCTQCHFPLQDNGCITCHKGTPSHAMSTPLPLDHNPAMNCRQCHRIGGTPAIPHPDNGQTCIACHR